MDQVRLIIVSAFRGNSAPADTWAFLDHVDRLLKAHDPHILLRRDPHLLPEQIDEMFLRISGLLAQPLKTSAAGIMDHV